MTTMDLCSILRIQARANRLANHRLHGTMRTLAPADFHAPRTGFFPSLAETLNHILLVDLYYIGALHADPDHGLVGDRYVAADDIATLAERQRTSDERLIAFCDGLTPAACGAVVAMDRGEGRVQHDLAAHVLMHLFMHQTHHRGQVHSMLSGTSTAPPQLDEFVMPSDARWRVQDVAELGWDEKVYRVSG